MKIKTLLSIVLVSFSTMLIAQEMSEEEIRKRIQPVGSVHVAGAEAASAGSSAGTRSGADVYNQACVACHGSGVLGAPKLQNAADWAPRMEQGMDVVLQNAINGINAMPPKGTCGNCSDDEIKAAIEHMIDGI